MKWLLGNMKFWSRLVCLGLLIVLAMTLLLGLSFHAGWTELQRHHNLMLESMAWNSRVKRSDESSLLQGETCDLFSSDLPHYANISTYDLFYGSQFNLRSDGDWELPPPVLEYNKSSKTGPRLEVFLVPHSHNDPGWLKTVNEYYSDQTRHILNNMVNKLTKYPNLTFIWAETVYFSMWWTELDDAVKVHVRRLLRRGQLEVTLGGWVMPDEASSHYVSVIDQLIEGHQWLWENLGVRPDTSWSIDPFGYSGTMPYLWKLAGMSNMVVQRVHQAVKASLMKEKMLEFHWRQMWDKTGSTDIFCHVMPFMLYNIKYTCGPNHFTCLYFDFRLIPGEVSETQATEVSKANVESLAEMLYQQYRAKASYFRYNTILVPIGDDFRYDKEEEWEQQYNNYERLMAYINSRPDWNMHIQWGTLKQFFQQLHRDRTKKTFLSRHEDRPVVSGDFFPYSDRDMAYWTGYFSTRPFDKYLGRELQWTLQAADILNTLYYAFSQKWKLKAEVTFSTHSSLLQQARRALALFQHHDAITGTAKPFVADDYEQIMFRGFQQAQEVARFVIQWLLSDGQVPAPAVFQPETVRRHHTTLPEKQVISVTESGATVAFFNSLAQPRQQIVHLLVNTQFLEVMSSTGHVLPHQISQALSTGAQPVLLDDVFELTFLVDTEALAISSYNLYRRTRPPMSLYVASIEIINRSGDPVTDSVLFYVKSSKPSQTDAISVDNKVIQLTFDPQTGSLLQVLNMITGSVTQLNLTFQVYRSQGSGAYLFSPKEAATNLFSNIPTIHVTRGSLTTSVVVDFRQYVAHRVTLYHYPANLASAIFIDNTVNIQPLKDKELVMRLNTDIHNSHLSYFTDQNGFQFIRRRTNRSLRTEANYYPMTSGLILEDDVTRLTLLSGQPHGVACLEPGQAEVMLDRQLTWDDRRGLGEGVQDIKPTISKFVVIVEQRSPPAKTAGSSRSAAHLTSLSLAALSLSDTLQQPLLPYFTTATTNIFSTTLAPLSTPLPCDVSLVSFRSLATADLNYNGTSMILHRRGYDCSFPWSHPHCSLTDNSMTFSSLLAGFPMSNIQETSLTHTIVKRPVLPADRISLNPMTIVAFHFHF